METATIAPCLKPSPCTVLHLLGNVVARHLSTNYQQLPSQTSHLRNDVVIVASTKAVQTDC